MTACLSSADFPPLPKGKATQSIGLYFEPQKQGMCGVHALNHVVGHPVFSAAELGHDATELMDPDATEFMGLDATEFTD